MKKTASVCALFLAGCSILGASYSGETTAGAVLKSDTERVVRLYFQTNHPCSPEKIHTRIDNVRPATADSPLQVQEIWTASGCGNTETFRIRYTDDGKGGTFFGVSPQN